jgi:hypothetical protein
MGASKLDEKIAIVKETKNTDQALMRVYETFFNLARKLA